MSDATRGPFEDAARSNKDEFFRHVGKRIRRRRRLLGLTQVELGEQVGVKFQQIQKYEAAENRPSFDTMVDLGKVLHVPLDYFLPDQHKSQPYVTPNLSEAWDKLAEILPELSPEKEAVLIELVRAWAKPRDLSDGP